MARFLFLEDFLKMTHIIEIFPESNKIHYLKLYLEG
jgi:hypothetical protein